MTKQNIMIGCDLHDKNMRLKIGIDCAEPVTRTVLNSQGGRRSLIEELKREATEIASKRHANPFLRPLLNPPVDGIRSRVEMRRFAGQQLRDQPPGRRRH